MIDPPPPAPDRGISVRRHSRDQERRVVQQNSMLRTFLLAIVLIMSTQAAVKIEKTSYDGWPNCYRITNGEVELIVTTDVGPRVIRYGFVGGQNLFKEFKEQLGKSGEKEWQARGGHRLWFSPEDAKLTYALDNGPVKASINRRGDRTDSAG